MAFFLQPQVKIKAILRSSRSRIVWIVRPRKDGRVNRVSRMREREREREKERMGMIHVERLCVCGSRIYMKLFWFLITCGGVRVHGTAFYASIPARCSLSCSRARKDSIKHTRFHGIDRLVVKIWALDLLHGRRNALEVG